MRNTTLIGSAAVVALALATNVGAQESAEGPKPEPLRISLWDGKAPIDNGDVREDVEVFLTVYRPELPNGTAMVICPGGGYGGLAIQPEGHGIAAWLNKNGITGVVLAYRLPAGRSFVPLVDVQRAIRATRSRAAEWEIDPARIGVIGFSAGGHLASTAATHFEDGNPGAKDPVDRVSSRPDFAILIYPVISLGEKGHVGTRRNLLGSNPDQKLIEFFSNEKQVTEKTPPTFLAHPLDDRVVVPDNSRMFYDALVAHKVPAKYLELPSGGHGLNGYKGPMWDAWQTQSLEWLEEMKLLKRN